MRAISLWQPWATLVAIGAKKIETRHWKTDYRGPLAIHAAKRQMDPICRTEPFWSVLEAAGYDDLECFAFGKIVAIVDLARCKFITSAMSPESFPGDFEARDTMLPPNEPERSFGNYQCGRYGWMLDNVRKLPNPIPEKGRQSFWDWKVQWCGSCDGVGLMEGWNNRDGWPCPECKGMGIVPSLEVTRA